MVHQRISALSARAVILIRVIISAPKYDVVPEKYDRRVWAAHWHPVEPWSMIPRRCRRGHAAFASERTVGTTRFDCLLDTAI